MASIPTPARILVVVLGLAAGLSWVHGRATRREELVLEPASREEAMRLGALEAPRALEAAPALPTVPTLPPGTARARPPGPPASAAERGDDLSAEMRLVGEARRTMGEDPVEALALLDQHRERHPAGALREEREAHAILILRRLERTLDAERRYADFLTDFPDSTFLPALRADSEARSSGGVPRLSRSAR
jgi:hypothetical protein